MASIICVLCLLVLFVGTLGFGFDAGRGGPYYGWPRFPTETAAWLPLPSTAVGTCQINATYRITSIDNLKDRSAELQCVFSAGLTPSRVPLGPQPGYPLVTLNRRAPLLHVLLLSFLMSRGNFAVPGECGNKSAAITFFNTRGRPTNPGLTTIANLTGASLAPGEVDDGRASLVVDYTKDIRNTCPDLKLKDFHGIVLPRSLAWPQTLFVNTVRLVGRMVDGTGIYLGKSYVVDAFQADRQMATVAWWYLTNRDAGVNPEFRPGDSLPPLEAGFSYMFPGLGDLILRLLPFDNLAISPLRTLPRLWRGFQRSAANFWLLSRDQLSLVGRRSKNKERMREFWRGKDLRSSVLM